MTPQCIVRIINMKAINQSKRESPDRVQNIIEDDIYKHHLIMAFIDLSAKSILGIPNLDKCICTYQIEKLDKSAPMELWGPPCFPSVYITY